MDGFQQKKAPRNVKTLANGPNEKLSKVSDGGGSEILIMRWEI